MSEPISELMSEEKMIDSVQNYINHIRTGENPRYGINQWQLGIENLLNRYKKEKEKNNRLVKDNLDLKDLYIKTAKKLEQNGKVELAEYFLAQVDACPTFTTWEEYNNWIHRDKIKGKIDLFKNRLDDENGVKTINYHLYNILIEEFSSLLEEK